MPWWRKEWFHGGVAYIGCLDAVKSLKLEDDQVYGARIVTRALEEPLRQIAVNAGQDGALVVDHVMNKDGSYGFNALKEVY